jgi:ABC-type multidrug transport system ATPase subunit
MDVTTSTPDALWASRAASRLRPTAAECHALRRSVAGQPLLAGVDLVVPVGARLLLVSRPDASASLLLRIMSGLATAQAGVIRLAGLSLSDAGPRGWARRVAYVGPNADIYPWLSPREALELAARLGGVQAAARGRLVDSSLEHHGLSAVAERPIRRGGPAIAQRVAFAAALLSDPEVLLLDEPLRALHAEDRNRLLRLPGPRRTVLLASRHPATERGLVDRFALLIDGRVRLHLPISKLEAQGLPLTLQGIEALEPRHAG